MLIQLTSACVHVRIYVKTQLLLVCKGCIYRYFAEQPNRNKCPQCATELGGKPIEALVRDMTLQNIVDWLIPDFKERDDKLKAQLLKQVNEKRAAKGTLKSTTAIKKKGPQGTPAPPLPIKSDGDAPSGSVVQEINFEFKLLPFREEDQHLRMIELPKKLKFANKNKTILTVKKHIHNYLKEPIDNIEILCKNFPVADSHSLEYIKKTKWQNANKTMVLEYKRKKRIMSHANPSAAKH